MTKSAIAILALGIACFVIGGCATGPNYSTLASTLPPVAPGQGRVFLYRDSLYKGSAIQPDILIDGRHVGSAVPGGVFFVDLPPGLHAVLCDKLTTNIHLVAGESRYVCLENYDSGNFIWSVRPIVVHPDQGSQEILHLHYIGTAAKP